MIISFKNKGSEDIYDGLDTKAARRILPRELHQAAGKKLDRLSSAVSVKSLSLPGLKLEKLTGDRAGWYSIRINDQYRICFQWTELGADDVEIVDYH